MKIVIIGSGNVAFHLAKAFHQNEIPVAQVFGRNEEALAQISGLFNIPFSTENIGDADLYLVAVNDDSISDISAKITKKDCIVAHTSGSLPVDVLTGSYRKASFYPLQTFSKSKSLNYSEIPFFVECENEDDQKSLEDLAHKISEKVMASDFEKRKYVHLTAVFSCNFVNHLFARAKEISDAQNIPFYYFLPLIEETTSKIQVLEPKDAQTGPAVRNDTRILEVHQSLITNPEQLQIYRTMNASIKKMYDL